MVTRASAAAILLVVLVAVGGVVPAMAQSTTQSDDWPDTFDSATQVSPGTYDGVVGSESDNDVMKVPVERGDTVTVTLHKEVGAGINVNLEWPDSRTHLLEGESQDALTRKVTAKADGYVYVSVWSRTAGEEPESWEVTVERTEGADQWPQVYSGTDPSSPGTYAGELNSPDDADVLKIPVERGDTVTTTLEKESGAGIYASLEWPDGRSHLVEAESQDTLTRKVTAMSDGYVYLTLASRTVETGTEPWELTVERTEGADEWPNAAARADEVSVGSQVAGEVDSPDDAEYLNVPVSRGDTVTFEFSKSSGDDVYMDVFWAGTADTVDGEGEETLTKTVTAEEDGSLTVAIGSRTVETGTEPWSLAVREGSRETETTATTTESTTTTEPTATTADTTTTTESTTTTTSAPESTSATPTSTSTPTPTETPSTTPPPESTATSTPTEEPATTRTATPTPETATPETSTTTREVFTPTDDEAGGVDAPTDDEAGGVDAPTDTYRTDEQDTTSDGSTPGFGVTSALAALLVVAYVAMRQS